MAVAAWRQLLRLQLLRYKDRMSLKARPPLKRRSAPGMELPSSKQRSDTPLTRHHNSRAVRATPRRRPPTAPTLPKLPKDRTSAVARKQMDQRWRASLLSVAMETPLPRVRPVRILLRLSQNQQQAHRPWSCSPPPPLPVYHRLSRRLHRLGRPQRSRPPARVLVRALALTPAPAPTLRVLEHH